MDYETSTLPQSQIDEYSMKEKNSLTIATEGVSDESFIVRFSPGDLRNPINFSKTRKWIITVVTSFFTLLVSASATSFSEGEASMMKDLNCTSFEATLGLSLYCLGFGIVPLFTSALSEEFGRKPLYYVSVAGFVLMHLMAALSPNIQVVVVARFLQGAFGSTGATMVAGTIADVWSPKRRGLPMSFYSAIAFAGNGVGAFIGGWTETNPKLGWRWIQWIHVIIGGAYLLVIILVVEETRTSVILGKLAHRLRKTTGDQRYRAYSLDDNKTLRDMIYVSCTRPIYLLFCEPIVFAVSLWIGFAWGVYYCMIESIPGVFRLLHGFNQGQIGSIYMTMVVGSCLGFFTNMYQEAMYQKNVAKRGPQARLYVSCLAGFLFPISMFMFAWSSTPAVQWIVLAIALTIYVWAVFTIYLAVFTYLADCYGIYASSALAGQSLFRNLMATAFPLFADRMFHKLGYKWANTLFACAGLAMSPIPIVLFFYGPRILARSNISNTINRASLEEDRH
ncbi:major facilitator superfamily domain-containing protein [Flammula alnicola]|nr:major facilitator superfamily domain-containing protein [Flammula alnicola]